jgi:hypothetical protein
MLSAAIYNSLGTARMKDHSDSLAGPSSSAAADFKVVAAESDFESSESASTTSASEPEDEPLNKTKGNGKASKRKSKATWAQIRQEQKDAANPSFKEEQAMMKRLGRKLTRVCASTPFVAGSRFTASHLVG